MRVTDPDGVEWDVSRDWLEIPRWRVGHPRLDDAFAPWDGDIDLAGIAAFVALTLVLFVLLLVGLPVLVFAAALLFAAAGLVSRILFGRSWRVEAKSTRGELAWRVRGTRGSRRAMHEIAAALRRGDRDFSPGGADRLLTDSPFSNDERGNVRVLR